MSRSGDPATIRRWHHRGRGPPYNADSWIIQSLTLNFELWSSLWTSLYLPWKEN